MFQGMLFKCAFFSNTLMWFLVHANSIKHWFNRKCNELSPWERLLFWDKFCFVFVSHGSPMIICICVLVFANLLYNMHSFFPWKYFHHFSANWKYFLHKLQPTSNNFWHGNFFKFKPQVIAHWMVWRPHSEHSSPFDLRFSKLQSWRPTQPVFALLPARASVIDFKLQALNKHQ